MPSRKAANQEDVRPARPVPTVKQEATTHTGGNTSGHSSGIGVGF